MGKVIKSVAQLAKSHLTTCRVGDFQLLVCLDYKLTVCLRRTVRQGQEVLCRPKGGFLNCTLKTTTSQGRFQRIVIMSSDFWLDCNRTAADWLSDRVEEYC